MLGRSMARPCCPRYFNTNTRSLSSPTQPPLSTRGALASDRMAVTKMSFCNADLLAVTKCRFETVARADAYAMLLNEDRRLRHPRAAWPLQSVTGARSDATIGLAALLPMRARDTHVPPRPGRPGDPRQKPRPRTRGCAATDPASSATAVVCPAHDRRVRMTSQALPLPTVLRALEQPAGKKLESRI